MTVLEMMPTSMDLDVTVDQRQDLAGGVAAAVFDPSRSYRYLLTRVWDPSKPPLVWVMLNPSTADALSVGQSRIVAWDFTRSMMPKRCASTNRGSMHARSAFSWASQPTQCAGLSGGRAYRLATEDPFQSTIRRSPTCTDQDRLSTTSPSSYGSAGSSFGAAWNGQESAGGNLPTTEGFLSTKTGWSRSTRRLEVQTRSHAHLVCHSPLFSTFSTNTAFEHGTGSTSSVRGRRRRPSLCTEAASPCGRSSDSWGCHRGLFRSPSGASASLLRTEAFSTARVASEWAREALTSEFALKTPIQWWSCAKQVASLLSIVWSWRATSADRCCLVKPSTTSTTTDTTTGLKTFSFESASTERATCFSAATADLIAFIQPLWRSQAGGGA